MPALCDTEHLSELCGTDEPLETLVDKELVRKRNAVHSEVYTREFYHRCSAGPHAHQFSPAVCRLSRFFKGLLQSRFSRRMLSYCVYAMTRA